MEGSSEEPRGDATKTTALQVIIGGAFLRLGQIPTRVKPILALTGILIMLAACQTQAAGPTPTISAPPATATLPNVTAVPAGLFFDGFKMVDAQSGWAWKGLSQLYRTDDGGASWTEIHLFGKMLTAGGSYLDRNEAWLPGVVDAAITEGVFHTADGGKTWTELARLHGPNLVFDFHDSKAGWATNGIGAAGNIFYQVYQTMDGGRTWMQLQPASRGGSGQAPMAGTIHVAAGDTLSFTPPTTIWITSGYGISTPYAGLTVSRDGGKTWQDINPVLPAGDITGQPPITVAAPQFTTDRDAYLPLTAGNRLLFFTSHDGGNAWQLLPAALPAGQMLPRVQFVSKDDGFAVCGSNLCVTHDGAGTWQQIQAPFSFSPTQAGSRALQFDFVDARTGWAIVEDQDGRTLFVKTTDGGRTWIDLEPRLGF